MTEKKETNSYAALVAAQTDMPRTVLKSADNPHFKTKYADLADVARAVVPHLNKHGLALFHKIIKDEPVSLLRTILAFAETGETIECDVPLIVDRQNMQGFKSAVTYAKRIGLESVTGVAPSEDDDGNAASAAAPEPRPKSAYSLKGQGKNGDGVNQWDKVKSQLDNELLDLPHTRAALVDLRKAYISEAKASGWPNQWLDSLNEEFAKVAEEWGVTEKEPNVLMAG